MACLQSFGDLLCKLPTPSFFQWSGRRPRSRKSRSGPRCRRRATVTRGPFRGRCRARCKVHPGRSCRRARCKARLTPPLTRITVSSDPSNLEENIFDNFLYTVRSDPKFKSSSFLKYTMLSVPLFPNQSIMIGFIVSLYCTSVDVVSEI